jgi:Calx-beta domain/Protein of unknown function (DUF1565)
MAMRTFGPCDTWGSLRRTVGLCLAVSLAFGTVAVPEAWATDYYVSAGTGANGNDGSSGAPWKTLTYALGQVTSGDTLNVAAGTYDTPTNGETFPLTLVDGVAIIGDITTPSNCVISAPAASPIFRNDNTNLSATTRLAGVQLKHDVSGSNEDDIDLYVNDVAMAPHFDHDLLSGDTGDSDGGISVWDHTLSGTGGASGTFQPTIENDTFSGLHTGVGMWLSSGGGSGDNYSPAINNNTFTGCNVPIYFGLETSAAGTVGGTISGNQTTGTTDADIDVNFFADWTPGLTFNPTISGNTFGSIPSSTGASENIYLPIAVSNATGPIAIVPQISGNAGFAKGDNILVDQMNLWSGSGNFTFSPTISNNTLTSKNGSNVGATSLVAYSQSGAFDVEPTISNNNLTATGSSGSNVFFAGFSLGASSASLTFSPKVTDNPQMSADFENFTTWGTLNGFDGDVDVSPTVSGNTMTSAGNGDSQLLVRLEDMSFSYSDPPHTLTFSPTLENNTMTAGGKSAVDLLLSNVDWGAFDSNLVISGNTISGADNGVSAKLSQFASALGWNADWTIANNTITSPSGSGISVSAHTAMSMSVASGTWDLTVAGNTVTDARGAGVFLRPVAYFGSNAHIDASVLIQGNTLTRSGGFGELELEEYSQDGLASNDTRILDNVIQDGTADGLRILMDNSRTDSALVSCNTITGNNGNGVYEEDSSTSADPPGDYGGGSRNSPGGNILTGNGDHSTTFDFNNQRGQGSGLVTAMAENNWWGQATGPAAGQISGPVDTSNFLTAAPTVTLQAELTAANVDDVAPAGNSVGDTFKYTADITPAGGSCGDTSLTFTVPIPANASLVSGSITTTKGTITNTAPVTVDIGPVTAGETVTVTWEVIPASGTQISSQGTVSATKSGTTPSDDPGTGTPLDPTVTLLFVPQPGAVQFAVAAATVSEGAGSITLDVTRTGGSAGAIAANYATADGTATAPDDYTATSGTLNWADGDATTKQIVVPIVDDSTPEGDETFTVTLTDPPGPADIGSPATTTVTIKDNDTAIPMFGGWGLVALAGALLLLGVALQRRRRFAAAGLALVLALGSGWVGAAPLRHALVQHGARQVTVTASTVETATVAVARVAVAACPGSGSVGRATHREQETVTLTLADGTSITAPRYALRVRDLRNRPKRPDLEGLSKADRLIVASKLRAERQAARAARQAAHAAMTPEQRAQWRQQHRAQRQQELAASLAIRRDPTALLAAGTPVVVRVVRDRNGRIESARVEVYATAERARAEVERIETRRAEQQAKHAAR